MSPNSFCDELSKNFKDLTKNLNLSNNDFIRTTEERHYKSVEKIWNKLVDSGDIYLDKYSGWYSISDEAFYDEEETELKNNIRMSITSGSKVEWVEEESYFFKLSAWGNKLLKYYETNQEFIKPDSRKNEVINFVKKGLKDLSISRTSFNWGISVPNNNKHVIYVWLDALTNYISALNYPDTNEDLFKKFWPASIHIIGKDILRFHAIYWPAFLMAAEIDLPKQIYGHGWILSDEKKMSKSLGNILDPIKVIEEFGIDQLRYYLTKEVSLGNDGSISLENLKNCINNDLANNYGNLCQRVFSFIEKNCNSKIPRPSDFSAKDHKLTNNLINSFQDLENDINKRNLNSYLKKIINFSFETNKYFNDSEPWNEKKINIKKMNTILFTTVVQIKNISLLLNPIMPLSTNIILDKLNIKNEDRLFKNIFNNKLLNHDLALKKSEILFKKVEYDN